MSNNLYAVRNSDIDTSEFATLEEIRSSTRSAVLAPESVTSHQSLRIAASLIFGGIVVFLFSLIVVPWVQNI